MNLRQLRALSEVAACGLNISHAAKVLHISQPSVSRHLSSLEGEVGAALFHRTDKRIVGMTDAGGEILRAARRMLQEAENIKAIGKDHSDESRGELTIGAAHSTARYFLPGIVTRFIAKHPGVHLVMRQADPSRIAHLVRTGEIDIAVSPAGSEPSPDLVLIRCHQHGRIALVPAGHELLRARRPTLAQLAKYPLITYSREIPAYAQIMGCFKARRLNPNVVLTASDIDVMKTYVECGLGIALVASLAYDPRKDAALRPIDISKLIPPVTINLCLRRGSHIRSYAYNFIELVAPELTRLAVTQAIRG